jgi:hypothetical protein
MRKKNIIGNAKGQTEILGFAMVVLLVSVGMLFVIGFIVLQADSDIKKVFTDKSLAVNMNDAILSSTSGCKNIGFERLIVDCAEFQEIRCDGSNTQRSCDYLQVTISSIFSETLDIWGKEYRYSIYIDGEDPLVVVGNGACDGDIEPGIFYLPTAKGLVIVRLDICS